MKKHRSLPYILILAAVSFFSFFVHLPISATASGDPSVLLRAATATALVAFLYLLVARVSNSRGIPAMSALILATMGVTIWLSRTPNEGIYAATAMTGGIFFMMQGLTAKCRGAGWMVPAGIMIAVSALILPAMLFTMLLPFVLGCSLAIRPRLHRKGIPVLILLLTAVTTYFATPYFITSLPTIPIQATREPFYFYFPVTTGIWAALVITATVWYFVRRRPGRHRRLYAFSVIWMLSSVIMLCILPEQLPGLTAAIPASLVTAMYLWNIDRGNPGKISRAFFRANSLLLALATLAVPAMLFILKLHHTIPTLLTVAITMVFTVLTGVILLATFRHRGRPSVKIIFAVTILAVSAFQLLIYPVFISIPN